MSRELSLEWILEYAQICAAENNKLLSRSIKPKGAYR